MAEIAKTMPYWHDYSRRARRCRRWDLTVKCLPAIGLSLEEIMERADEARAEHYLRKYRRIFGKDFLAKKD